MKRIATFILLIGFAFQAFADNVSLNRAEYLAKSFFSGSSTRASLVKVEMVWDGTDGQTRAGEAPAFYVFNRDGGGFVVIAGDDAAVPVLGYSDNGGFNSENIHPNVKGWFDMYKREIEFLRSNGISPDAGMEAKWDASSVRAIRKSTGKTLNTRSWGQDAPYNLRCPVVDGLQSVTGCVATAVCEVMCFHQWPQTVTGLLPSYSYRTDKNHNRTEPEHRLDTTYNWSQMPVSRLSYTSEQAQNVSKLMFDVAVMLESSFNGVDNQASGTGAYSESIVAAMVKYMDYDSSAILLDRDNYSTLRWAEILRSEIDENRPMPYSGDDGQYGHQFVVDGYDSNGDFHINWGWDGEDNGFFAISSFYLDKDYDFRYDQSAVIGLKPDEGGHPISDFAFYAESGTAGVSLASGTIESGSFSLKIGDFYNFGAFDITADFAVLLLDYDDNAKCAASGLASETIPFGAGVQAFSFPCSLSQEYLASLSFGDKLAFCYCPVGEGWRKMEVDGYSRPGLSDYPVYDVPCIKVNATATYSASDYIPLEIVNTRTVPTSVTWYIDGSQYNDTEVVLPAGVHTIKCVAKISNVNQTLVQQITVTP